MNYFEIFNSPFTFSNNILHLQLFVVYVNLKFKIRYYKLQLSNEVLLRHWSMVNASSGFIHFRHRVLRAHATKDLQCFLPFFASYSLPSQPVEVCKFDPNPIGFVPFGFRNKNIHFGSD
jgi:hypothetical protein